MTYVLQIILHEIFNWLNSLVVLFLHGFVMWTMLEPLFVIYVGTLGAKGGTRIETARDMTLVSINTWSYFNKNSQEKLKTGEQAGAA